MISARTFFEHQPPAAVGQGELPVEVVVDLRFLRTNQRSIDGDKVLLLFASGFDVSRVRICLTRGGDGFLYLRDGHHSAVCAICLGHFMWKFWRHENELRSWRERNGESV
jgi:hypothetical protein